MVELEWLESTLNNFRVCFISICRYVQTLLVTWFDEWLLLSFMKIDTSLIRGYLPSSSALLNGNSIRKINFHVSLNCWWDASILQINYKLNSRTFLTLKYTVQHLVLLSSDFSIQFSKCSCLKCRIEKNALQKLQKNVFLLIQRKYRKSAFQHHNNLGWKVLVNGIVIVIWWNLGEFNSNQTDQCKFRNRGRKCNSLIEMEPALSSIDWSSTHRSSQRHYSYGKEVDGPVPPRDLRFSGRLLGCTRAPDQ